MAEPYWQGRGQVLHLGDCLDVLATLADASADAVVTDPPYGLAELSTARVLTAISAWLAGDRGHVPDGRGFMGRDWDAFVPPPGVWDECLRVLKPGGHLLAFAGTRTVDLMMLSIRIAGFEIRDSIGWLYGQGFPKSLDVSKAIDRAMGAARPEIGLNPRAAQQTPKSDSTTFDTFAGTSAMLTAPGTPEAAQWDGWGTGLKPGHEPIVLARKPLAGTVAENVLERGTGALNIDGCRVGTVREVPASDSSRKTASVYGTFAAGGGADNLNPDMGRWPPNVLLTHSADCEPAGTRRVRTSDPRRADGTVNAEFGGHGIYGPADGDRRHRDWYAGPDGTETVEAWDCAPGCPAAEIDRQSGDRRGFAGDRVLTDSTGSRDIYGANIRVLKAGTTRPGFNDTGGASRFFPVSQWSARDLEFAFRYHAKATSAERPGKAHEDDEAHPTVKPLGVMLWLARLVCPPGGTVVDPFAGTGTTLEAAALLGLLGIGGENDAASCRLAVERLTDIGGRDRKIRARRPRKARAGQDALW